MNGRALTMRFTIACPALFFVAAAMLSGCASAPAEPTDKAAQAAARDEAQEVVDSAKATLDDMLGDPNYLSLQQGIKKARAVVIFPRILKAGFIVGGSGGRGVLLVRGRDGDWSQPAFYSTGAVSLGFQIGGEAVETVALVNSERGLRSFYNSSFKFGGDLSIAVGPVGAGQQAVIQADIVGYSKTKGAYAGINLEGMQLTARNDLNQAYHGPEVTPAQIIERKVAANPGATALRRDLKQFSRPTA